MGMPKYPVQAPPRTPTPFGLFSVAQPQPLSSDHAAAGVWWQSDTCDAGLLSITDDPCLSGDEVEALVPDDRACLVVTEAAPFTVYAWDEASMIDRLDDESPALDRLHAGEQITVEAWLWDQLTADVTPGAATDLGEAVARLEAVARQSYGAVPVLHVPTYAAALLVAEWLPDDNDGPVLRTPLGTPVVVGTGYGPTITTTAAPATVTLFVTGPVVVRRGEAVAHNTPGDLAVNDTQQIAERTYVVGWDCLAAGITVTLNGD